MGYKAVCTKCDWSSAESYPTETTARVDGTKHEQDEHDGEDCTEVHSRPPAQ